MTLMDKVLNWKNNKCGNPAHFQKSNEASELAQDCNDWHNEKDRRRPLFTMEFYQEVVDNYQGLVDA